MARLMEHILPSNATLFERSLATPHEDILALDTTRMRNLWNPWLCHIDDLPFLAWSLNVDLWDASWPESKRRGVVANALNHKKMKGTQAGVETYLDLVDCKALDFVVPPARGFRIPAMTQDQFAKWLSELPQIRIYPFSIPEPAGKRRFHKARGEFRSSGFRQPSIGSRLLGRRATLVHDGAEVEVQIDQVESFGDEAIEQVRFGKIDKRDFRTKDFRSAGFREPSDAALNVVTVRVSDTASAFSVTEGLLPQAVRPTRINESSVARPSVDFHQKRTFRGSGFRAATEAPLHIYDRLALYRKDDAPVGMQSRWYRGHKRFGIQKHTAKVTVSIPLLRSPSRGFGRFRNGFRVPTDMSRLDLACEAVTKAKALHETVLIDTVTHRVVTLKDKKRLGSFRLGAIIKVA